MGESTTQCQERAKIDRDAVHTAVKSCLLLPEEVLQIPKEKVEILRTGNKEAAARVAKEHGIVLASGAVMELAFSITRLEKVRDFVIGCLDTLPFIDPVYPWKFPFTSFVCLAEDKNKQHWGEHNDVDALLCLGLGLGLLGTVWLGDDVTALMVQYKRDGKIPG